MFFAKAAAQRDAVVPQGRHLLQTVFGCCVTSAASQPA
jgi:hypothetical protein